MTTNPAYRLFWKKIWAVQCQQRYRDTAPRGNGNRAARRAHWVCPEEERRLFPKSVLIHDTLTRGWQLAVLRPLVANIQKPLPPYL